MDRCCPLCSSSAIRVTDRLSREYAGREFVLSLGKCQACSFVFLLNDPHIQYDQDYLSLENVISAGSAIARFRAEERIASIAKKIPPIPGNHFLDIGIGDGLLLSIAEKAGYLTYGLDVNPYAIEIARDLHGISSDVRLDPLARAFPETLFAVIHMNEVIEHLADPMAMLLWCRDHLTENGIVVINTGNIDSIASRLMGRKWNYFRPAHVSYFSTRTLGFALGQAGLELTHRATIDWRLGSVFRLAQSLLIREGITAALGLIMLYISALPYGIRRSMLVFAGHE